MEPNLVDLEVLLVLEVLVLMLLTAVLSTTRAYLKEYVQILPLTLDW